MYSMHEINTHPEDIKVGGHHLRCSYYFPSVPAWWFVTKKMRSSHLLLLIFAVSGSRNERISTINDHLEKKAYVLEGNIISSLLLFVLLQGTVVHNHRVRWNRINSSDQNTTGGFVAGEMVHQVPVTIAGWKTLGLAKE